jgi:hypothetical protein
LVFPRVLALRLVLQPVSVLAVQGQRLAVPMALRLELLVLLLVLLLEILLLIFSWQLIFLKLRVQ